MNLRAEQLSQQLSKQLASIYLVGGAEPVLVQESSAAIRAAAKEQGYIERQIFYVDKDFSWQDFAMTTQNYSLFGDKTLLELRLPSGKPGDQGGKILQQYAQNPPEDKILLIETEKLDAATQKTKWFKAIAGAGDVVQIWPITMDQLPQWLNMRMQRQGLKTDREGLQLLAECVAGNLLAGAQEIEKLALLYGATTLTPEQIAAAINDNARFDIFDLVDIALQGNLTKSCRILANLKASKTEPTLILWALTRELRNLIAMVKDIEAGKSVDAVMQQHRVWRSRLKAIKSALQHHDSKSLKCMLQSCAAIDRIIKGAEVGNVWSEFEALCANMAKGFKHD